ncbi:MAG: hypothetical protein FJW66_00190 [Actinobacteria bacterium]|nr:hypothetical protein [Actinomycetota bacterium]
MYLKNITLRGFKSFAKKSQLTFEPGISVIVGPNGSGKSNIADAISWVMGEQSAKSLRGSSMEDVIFKSRNEELAIAEVSLMFENRDRFLPLEFNDVKIMRRVYQKGGSEYFINSTPCRLIDILDLTSERGIGKGLYTIINQGQIDEMALLKPSERKMVVDEILGIAKHKIRRAKSKAKLLKVNDDIERINDLVSEVKRTMDPLAIESEKAQKYFEVLNTLKDEEMGLFLQELDNLNSSWDLENKNYSDNKKNLEESDRKLAETEIERKDYEEKFSEKQEIFNRCKITIEKFNNHKSIIDRNISLLESKKNIFHMLFNLFRSQYISFSNASFDIVNSSAGSSRKEKDSRYIMEKLSESMERIRKFYIKVTALLEDEVVKKELEKDYHAIIEGMGKLEKLINVSSDNVPENTEMVPSGAGTSKNKIEELKTGIEKKLAEFEAVQEICLEKIKETARLFNVIENLKTSIERYGKSVYQEFEELAGEINNYNFKTADFLKKTTDANLKKQALENELYRIDFRREQIRERVKNLTEEILDSYNLPLEFIYKNYSPSEYPDKSKKTVRRLKNELKSFGSINPNATSEYKIIKERYDFLQLQKDDLTESRNKLQELIRDINKRIEEIFNLRFEEINSNFRSYFKSLFPLGNGEMFLTDTVVDDEKDHGIELKVDIGNSKIVPISLLSGGEKALVSIAFLFSVFATNYSPFYVFDEIDAALDDMNLNRFITLVRQFSRNRQILIITHQKKTMEIADTIYGVTMQSSGISKIVSEKVERENAEIN